MICADIHKQESRVVVWTDESKESIALRRVIDSLPYYLEFDNKYIISIYDFCLLKDGLDKENLKSRRMSGPLRDKISLLNSEGEELPDLNLKRPLLPFHEGGVKFLTSRNSLLADQMGLGKTGQVLAAANLLIKQGKAKHAIFLVTKSGMEHWCDQIKTMFYDEDIDYVVVRGKANKRLPMYKEDHKFYLVSLDTFKKDVEKLFPNRNKKLKEMWSKSIVVVDEIHRIKHSRTISAKACYKIGKYAAYRWGMTGTPLDGRVENLYGVMNFIDRDFFVNKGHCLSHHVITDFWGGITEYRNMESLKEKLKTVMIRRLKKDVWKELPDKAYLDHYIDLSAEEKKLYKQIKKQQLDMVSPEINEKINICLPIGLLSYGQMCVNTPTLIDRKWTKPSTKMKELYDLLEELTVISKVVVFTKFAKMCHILHQWLPWESVVFTGELTTKQRRKRQVDFLTKEEIRVFIMDTAGAQAIDLHGIEVDGVWHQGAEYLIRYDNLWNPAMNEQVEDRIHRVGQKEKVTIIDLIARGTIEEKIKSLLVAKKEVTKKVIDKDLTKKECMTLM